MYKRKISLILSLILILSVVLTACSGGGSNNDKAANNGSTIKDSINFSILSEPATLDPKSTNDSTAQMVQYQIFDTLVREEKDGSLVPSLAESWKISEDATEIVFNLRKDVKFHNGDVMTAEDVAFSINRSIESAYTSKMTNTMKSAEIVDANTVKLILKYPYGAILGALSSANLAIVNKKAVEADPEGFARNPIGTGAYMFKEWKNGEKIIFESFPDYFRGQAAIKNLSFRIITDASTGVVALENGETDIMDTPPKSERKNLIENKDLTYYEADQACYYLIAFNNKEGIFSNKKVREAVSYAVDRESIILGAIEGVGIPVEAAMVPVVPQYPEGFKANPYDPEKAKALLAEAGYADGFTVKMKTIQSPTYTKPTEVIQEQLRNIGITVEIEIMERGAYLADVTTDANYDITFWAIPITVLDADFAAYSAFHSSMTGGAGNFTEVNIPELDKLLEQGRVSQSEEERKEIYLKVAEIVKEESVLVPLFTGKRCIAANKDLKGVQASPVLKYYIFDYAW